MQILKPISVFNSTSKTELNPFKKVDVKSKSKKRRLKKDLSNEARLDS